MPASGKQGGKDFYGDTLDVQTANVSRDLTVTGTQTVIGPIVAQSVTVVGPNSPNTPSALALAMGGGVIGTKVIAPPPRGGGLDDSSNLQTVIDALSAAGGGLIEAWGLYTCNIILKDGVFIIGMNSFRAKPGAGATRFNQFGAGAVIDTPAGNIQACGVLGIAFQGLGAGTPGNGVRFQNVTAGILKGCSANNFADEGFAVRNACIVVSTEDLFAQNCVLNTTRAAVIGAVDIDGTDHFISRVEATTSRGAGKTDANLYCCGIVIRGANHWADSLVGEISDQGIVVLAGTSRFTKVRGDLNAGHGINVLGSGNTFGQSMGLNNSQDTTNTYDNWRIDNAAVNNQLDGCQALSNTAAVAKYGFEDLVTSGTQKTRYSNCYSLGAGTLDYSTSTNNGSGFLFPSGTRTILTANSTTPSVAGNERFSTNNSAPTTITDFTGGVQGQRLLILCNDSNTTIQHNGATISLRGGGNKKLLSGVNYEFVKSGNAWGDIKPYPFSVSADNGDAIKTLQADRDETTQIWGTALTANRAVTLSATGAYIGAKFRIVRKVASTGASTLDIGTGPLKSLAAGQWGDVEYDGAAWFLSAFGSL